MKRSYSQRGKSVTQEGVCSGVFTVLAELVLSDTCTKLINLGFRIETITCFITQSTSE